MLLEATLFVAIFLMFLLVDRAMDPLSDLRESTAPNKEQLIAQRDEYLDQLQRSRAEFINYLRVREWQDLFAQLRQLARPLGLVVRPESGLVLNLRLRWADRRP